MASTNDITTRLRAMSRYAHDDLSIGDEAADEIERLQHGARLAARALHWIDVAAGLPDDDITVLCWIGETCVWFAGWHDADGWRDAVHGNMIEGVTHWSDPIAPGADIAADDDRKRLIDRVERLRGLCKTAVGMLRDAGRDADAELIHGLIGDMEDGALRQHGAGLPGALRDQGVSAR